MDPIVLPRKIIEKMATEAELLTAGFLIPGQQGFATDTGNIIQASLDVVPVLKRVLGEEALEAFIGSAELTYSQMDTAFQAERNSPIASQEDLENLSFLGLLDVPGSYQALVGNGYVDALVKVNGDKTGLEFGPRTKSGSIFVEARGSSSNDVIASNIEVKWQSFGDWMFVRIEDFTGSFLGAGDPGIDFVGVYPIEWNPNVDINYPRGQAFAGQIIQAVGSGIFCTIKMDDKLQMRRAINSGNFSSGDMAYQGSSFMLDLGPNPSWP